ncbi:DUF421 domain-containing protein [Paenibacillus planticolens]|nr:DUF421 domain-containing protein [Paenibacillus planticolens]
MLETSLRTIAAFVLIMIITRILGKHTIARMTYNDFVASITLGSIIGNLAFNTHLKTWPMITSSVIFGGIVYLISVISLKSRKIRKWFAGKPTVVIENGKIMEENLRKIQFTLDTLNQELREKDIFDIEEVQYAILELNGRLSILKKPEYRPLIQKDLQLTNETKIQFPVELIMDGKIMTTNLQQIGLSKEWLSKQLRQRGVTVDEVCYAIRGTHGKLFFDLYHDKIRHPIDQE